MAASRERPKKNDTNRPAGASAEDAARCTPVPPPPPSGVGSLAAAEPIVRWEGEGGMTPRDDAARAASPDTGGKPAVTAEPKPPPPARPEPR
jgi:hypothetical protein